MKIKPRVWFVVFSMLAGLLLATLTPASSNFQKTNLNPVGSAYEINLDHQSRLIISDNGAGEIIVLDPFSEIITTYSGVNYASDARSDSTGAIWWVDNDANYIGRIIPGEEQFTQWVIPGAGILYGTEIDSYGKIWITDISRPHLYRFDPLSTQVCTYTIPNNGISDYLQVAEDQIWLGERRNGKMLRFTPATNALVAWVLPNSPSSEPEGLALDSNQKIWWADPNRGQLACLDSSNNSLYEYPLPYGSSPEMIDSNEGFIWYTEDGMITFGRLDPSIAISVSSKLLTETYMIEPSCSILGGGITDTITITTQSILWTTDPYTVGYAAQGWMIYDLPEDSAPWGISSKTGSVWFVDYGRQNIIQMEDVGNLFKNYLPLVIR